jgi:hypothetical protein
VLTDPLKRLLDNQTWIKVYVSSACVPARIALSLILNKPVTINRVIFSLWKLRFAVLVCTNVALEFQKYNSKYRFIGFPPIQAFIIRPLGITDAASNTGSPNPGHSVIDRNSMPQDFE